MDATNSIVLVYDDTNKSTVRGRHQMHAKYNAAHKREFKSKFVWSQYDLEGNPVNNAAKVYENEFKPLIDSERKKLKISKAKHMRQSKLMDALSCN